MHSQNNPDRTWELTGENLENTMHLVSVLKEAIGETFPDAQVFSAAETDESEVPMIPSGGIWMSKKGEGLGAALTGEKRRFFELVYSTKKKMLLLNYFAGLNNNVPVDKKGSVLITQASSISPKGQNLNVVSFARFVLSKI